VREDGSVLLQFVPAGGAGTAGTAAREEDLLRRLGDDVIDLRLGAVDFTSTEDESGDAKGAAGALEWLAVAVTAGPSLVELLRLASDWTRRARQPVRVRIGKDELVLEQATPEQQEKIIEAFLARRRSS
jgi:hypothetical protein